MDLSRISLVDVLFSVLTMALLLISWVKYRGRRKMGVDTTSKLNVSVLIVFGSQTGTAESFALSLHSSFFSSGVGSIVLDIRDCSVLELSTLSQLTNNVVLFILATHGEGEPTDTAQAFMNELQETDIALSGISFTVFGLGNSSYTYFNACATSADRLLHQHGATRLSPLALGDELDSLESTFLHWQSDLLLRVKEHLCVDSTNDPNTSVQHLYKATHLPQSYAKKKLLYTGEPYAMGSYTLQKQPFDSKNPYLARVLVNRELYTSGHRSCRHIEVDIDGANFMYAPGDHAAILPCNPSRLVDCLANRLGLDLDQSFSLEAINDLNPLRHPFPCPCTYRSALTHYVDLAGAPRLSLLTSLSHFATDKAEAARLQLLGSISSEGKNLYSAWISDARRNIVNVLCTFKSVQLSVDILLELLPRLKPRYYSISSSMLHDPSRLHLTVVVVEKKTDACEFRGLASDWLCSLNPSELIPMYCRSSKFNLPRSRNIPIIMVATGTGLAPFRAFIQERSAQKQKGLKVGQMLLFYGCRSHSEDYLYSKELENVQASGTVELHLAFSRDSSDGSKVYVQDKMDQAAEQVWSLLDSRHAHLYLCGSAQTMTRDVHACLLRIVQKANAMSLKQAEVYVKRLRIDGRYHVDVWN